MKGLVKRACLVYARAMCQLARYAAASINILSRVKPREPQLQIYSRSRIRLAEWDYDTGMLGFQGGCCFQYQGKSVLLLLLLLLLLARCFSLSLVHSLPCSIARQLDSRRFGQYAVCRSRQQH
jgi:hypothetical protein